MNKLVFVERLKEKLIPTKIYEDLIHGHTRSLWNFMDLYLSIIEDQIEYDWHDLIKELDKARFYQ